MASPGQHATWATPWRVGCVAAAAAVMSGAAASGHIPPQPDPVPRRWQLDVQVGDLRLISLETDGRAGAYFVLTYTVTNNSGQDLLFAPAFELVDDEGNVLRSGRNVPPAVTERLLELFDNPFLQDQISILGPLLQGRENAREGLVVWSAADLDVDELVVYAMGFSGESKPYTIYDAGGRPVETFVLRKTLMLRHRVDGELDPASTRAIPRTATEWIMRKSQS